MQRMGLDKFDRDAPVSQSNRVTVDVVWPFKLTLTTDPPKGGVYPQGRGSNDVAAVEHYLSKLISSLSAPTAPAIINLPILIR